MITQDFAQAGLFFGHNLQSRTDAPTKPNAPGELERWFDEHTDGDGVWKWRHYFDIYERHFRKFVGREVHMLEIGIYSGGSLEMWREYFGDGLHLYGVDIAPEVVAYESDEVKILVGDQGDPNFWARAMADIPKLDIVIDDGGHEPHQLRVTLESLLPVLSPGGVFLCEDIHHPRNEFWNYVNGLERNLHHWEVQAVGPGREATIGPNNFQRLISSVHQYPYVVVLERRDEPLATLQSERHGTNWQPFSCGAHGVGTDRPARP
jgi:SAM-dependent methyltransferase